MMQESNFRVAGFLLKLYLPQGQDATRLLPSFRPFRCQLTALETPLFYFVVMSQPLQTTLGKMRVLEETENELGRVRLLEGETKEYRVELCRVAGGPVHVLHVDAYFTFAKASICWDDPYAGEALSSLLRIVYSQAIIFRGGISVHAATVSWRDKAYLFMGKSGIGKSTHAKLWLQHLSGSELLNDDNPTLRIEYGIPYAYGTPWSGKTPCYKNRCYRVGGIVRLRQANVNRFLLRQDVEAFTTLLPGCSAIRTCHELYDNLCDTLVNIIGIVTVGELECLPNEEAAKLCAVSLTRDEFDV